MFAVALTGWYIGFIVTALLIVVVVILVAMLLVLARRIGAQAAEIDAVLEESRANTEALWELAVVNAAVGDIIEHASVLRRNLEEV